MYTMYIRAYGSSELYLYGFEKNKKKNSLSPCAMDTAGGRGTEGAVSAASLRIAARSLGADAQSIG
jgi:hypothetical protein